MKRRVRKRILLALVCGLLLSSLLVGGVTLAAVEQDIDWWVIGAGGGRAQGGAYTLEGTIGQAVVGQNSAGDSDLCAGFWCGFRPVKSFLPLISAD